MQGSRQLLIGLAIAAGALGGALACNALLGLGDYTVTDGGVTTGGDGNPANCDPSATTDGGCFACTPVTNDQLEKACTDSTCLPFDDNARIPGFNGTLPSVPDIVDGG
ncbi:MAG: hypothetical protein ACRELY_16700 [Polyangiaceae bacterium]